LKFDAGQIDESLQKNNLRFMHVISAVWHTKFCVNRE